MTARATAARLKYAQAKQTGERTSGASKTFEFAQSDIGRFSSQQYNPAPFGKSFPFSQKPNLGGLTMLGHGRPISSHTPRILSQAKRMFGMSMFAWAVLWNCVAAVEAAPLAMRLRIAWGGGAERIWSGSIRLDSGTLSELQPLGIEADEAGTIWLDGNEIVVRGRSVRAYDGVDILAQADPSARLSINLASPGGQDKPVEIPLSELITQANSSELEGGNRLLVTRSPGDRLRVAFERDSLVFAAGDMFQLSVQPQLIGVSAGTQVRLSAQLVGAATGAKHWAQDYDLKIALDDEPQASAQLDIKLPDAEGVYDLVLSAANSRLAQPLWRRPLAERKLQLIVLAAKTPPAGDPQRSTMVKLLEIDPVNPRWSERISNVPLLTNWHKGPLGNGDAAKWEHPKLGPMIQLGAGGTGPGISWEAYPLPLTTPGQAHVLEIEYPSDVPQTMGISLMEPNAAGAVTPIGLDSGVYISDEEATSAPQLARHRVVFWPHTKTPLLLVTNRRYGSRAVYGKIRVLTFGAQRFATLPLVNRQIDAPPTLSRAFANDDRKPERLLAAYFNRPLFNENFSAAEALDPASNRCLDDWTTFYQGTTRLVEYLQHVGFSGAMIAVAADGSTIYPSQVLDATPRYDTGVFFATGQDAVRKDVLEVLFRLFDRSKLQLVPALHFATPLPSLEALKRQGASEATGIEWISSTGAPWLACHPPRQGLAAYYNPLDPRVQDAMLAVASEVVNRYAGHPSFAGLAVELSADGYAQLPSGDGSYDDATIARFVRDTKIQVPGSGPERFAVRAKFLTGTASRNWLTWRASVLADFHHRLQQVVGQVGPEARLYLSGTSMLDSPHIQRSLRPALPRRMKVEEVLLALGIRPQAYDTTSGIVFLRPHRVAPVHSLATQAVDLELNLSPEMDRLFAASHGAGSLTFHEPQRARLPSFDAKSPFGPNNTFTWLMSELSPSGDRNRRRFAHSLATLDSSAIFDGGWLLPLGQEDSLRDLISVYRDLPAGPFTTLEGDSQPIVIRTMTRGEQTYFYLVNDSPWAASVTLPVDVAPGVRLEKLGSGRGVGPLVRGADGSNLTLSLQAYDVIGARFNSPEVRWGTAHVVLADDAQNVLFSRIQDLSARAAALSNPATLTVLENPDFETSDQAGNVAGWSTNPVAAGAMTIDTAEKHSGAQSLRFASTTQRTSLRSNPFLAPQTGRLSVALWLRVGGQVPQPTLRLAVEGKLDENEYYRYATVGGSGPGAVALTTQWAQYVFQVDDLPANALSDLRVRFDLMGPGEVWIDDIQLYDLAFSENERVELTKIIVNADFNLKRGNVGDCMRLLEGYWPQFLQANVPLTQAPANVASRPRTAAREQRAPAPPAPPKKPGMFEQMKGYVPKLPQF